MILRQLYWFIATAALCVLSSARAQTITSETAEGVRLTPAQDLGSRAMQDYNVSNTAPLIIRSSPPPSQQQIRFESKPQINVGRGNFTGADGEERFLLPASAQPTRQEIDDRPRSEFQAFIYKTTGRDLAPYARSLFETSPTSFTIIERGIVPDDYVVGAGDEVVFRGWGQVDIDFRGGIVDAAGRLYIPHIGSINVAGLSLAELRVRIRQAVGRYYKNFELEVGLGQLRAVQIQVTGLAARPGSYTMQGMSSVVNAIFASGGPADAGTMRNIELRRNGRSIATVDLYSLVSSGRLPEAVRLRNGDVLHYAPIGAQVGLMGSVNQPAIYELKNTETLKDLLAYAGGLTPTAATQEVLVERINEQRNRSAEQVAYSQGGVSTLLRSGDVVFVAPITARFESTVTVQGHVPQSRRTAWRAGLRVRDVLPSVDAIMSSDFWRARGHASQQYRHWIQDKTRDASVTDARTQAGSPAAYDRSETELARDGLKSAGVRTLATVAAATPTAAKDDFPVTSSKLDMHWDNATIERLDRRTFKTTLINFHLGRAMLEGNAADNLLLEPGDVITLFSQSDVASPVARKTRYVRLEGEVERAGVYEISVGMTLVQLLEKAGGLTPNAWVFGSSLYRESARKVQQQELGINVDRLERELEKSATNRLRETLDAGSSGVADGGSSLLNSQRRLISRLRQVQASGRVVMPIAPNSNSATDLNYLLEDGDKIVIASPVSTVTVIGAVNRSNVMLYSANSGVKEYLAKAGGSTKDASLGEVFVVRADGSVVQANAAKGLWSSSGINVLPGDVIVVPEQTDFVSWRRVLRDWTTIGYQGFLSVVSLRTLVDLLK